eukprot:4158025-Prorocentrum_lima.AAC.1
MAVETCIMKTGDDGQVWQIKLHFPQEMSNWYKASQLNKFKENGRTSGQMSRWKGQTQVPPAWRTK